MLSERINKTQFLCTFDFIAAEIYQIPLFFQVYISKDFCHVYDDWGVALDVVAMHGYDFDLNCPLSAF